MKDLEKIMSHITKWDECRMAKCTRADSSYFDQKTCFKLKIDFHQMFYNNLISFILGFYIRLYALRESKGACDLECKRLKDTSYGDHKLHYSWKSISNITHI